MSVSLEWTESLAPASQIVKYQVWRAEVDVDVQPQLSDFSLLVELEVERDTFGEITNSPYSYEDLTADPESFFYFYFVKAIPVQGPSSRSDVVPVQQSSLFGSFTMDADPESTPAINVTWSKPISTPPVTNYLVQRSIDAGAFSTLVTLANNVFSYDDTDLALLPGSTFTYRIQATRPGGTRDSNTEDITVAVPTAPVLSGNYDSPNNEFDLSWTASVSSIGIASYTIERSVNSGAFVELDTVGGGTLVYTDDDPTIDRSVNEYDYRVIVEDNLGQTNTSNTLNFPVIAAQRVVFTANDTWQVPTGVTEIDILCVGGGGGGVRMFDTGDFFELMAAGGGGGGVVVTNGVSVTPLDNLTITVGAGSTAIGGSSQVQAPGPVTLAQAGGGGYGALGTSSVIQAVDGAATNGSGAGGNNDFVFGPLDFPPSVGNGTGNDGGTAALGSDTANHAAGGGGGAGANGGNGVAGVGAGVDGTPGVGGAGVVPAASTIGGAWGNDIGEGGFFGGGGGGSTWGASGSNWVIANNGVGNGANNTGGGGRTTASPTYSSAVAGFSGIVVIYYLG